MSSIDQLLENNRQWATRLRETHPGYFEDIARVHAPAYLWIGCSDARVPVSLITGIEPGEVFVHRNIANRVVADDTNIQAVLQYAIDYLKVEHIVVCGHYGCGGVKAGLEAFTDGPIRQWVEPIRRHSIACGICHETQGQNAEDISQELWDRACETHTLEQARNLEQNPTVEDARARGQEISIHALIYRLEDGLLQPLVPSSTT